MSIKRTKKKVLKFEQKFHFLFFISSKLHFHYNQKLNLLQKEKMKKKKVFQKEKLFFYSKIKITGDDSTRFGYFLIMNAISNGTSLFLINSKKKKVKLNSTTQHLLFLLF